MAAPSQNEITQLLVAWGNGDKAALERLARIDERKSRVTEYRFFAGLSVEETAAVLGVSPDTVMRGWRLARAWLHRELGAEAGYGA